MRLAILMPNWIGDAVMATPTLRALRAHFDQEYICGIMRPLIAETLSGSGWFDEVIYYDRRAGRKPLGTWSVARQIQQMQVDTILLLTNSLRSGLLAWAGGVKRRVGYARYGRSWLLTDRLPVQRQRGALVPVSPVDYYLELARAVGCLPGDRQLSLSTTAREESAADEAWRHCQFEASDPVIALNTGGAYGPAKDWPAEHFAALARRIAKEMYVHVLIVCGPSECETAAKIEQMAAHPWVRSLAQRPLSVGLTKACLRRSTLVVSTDSGPRHIAAAFGKPVVALFGPTDPRWSDNHHTHETQLSLELSCRPCSQRTCPLSHHQCMRDLSVGQVFRAVAAAWERRAEQAA